MRSVELFEQAKHLMPGGVNSPVRAFKGVGGTPLFMAKGQGPYVYDVDGRAYLDYVGSWGPLILGHAHKAVLTSLHACLHEGMTFGAPTVHEIRLAELIQQCMPSIEKIRMVNSGTEATMTAVRLARGVTQRSKILKFEGCYHGHSDSLLVSAGSGVLTLGMPACQGILPTVASETLVARFNDLAHVEQWFDLYGHDIAAVIVEPVAGNMGFVPPIPGFLEGLRALCDQAKSLLIFDEVMTGFRVALGGAQAHYQVIPDLTTLGKIIGGGLPVGALGGRAVIMDHLSPEGSVYQAGTLSGNPLAMVAGLATLTQLKAPDFFEVLASKTEALVSGILEITRRYAIPCVAQGLGGMFGFFFLEGTRMPRHYDDVKKVNVSFFKACYHHMLKRGIYLPPSCFEAMFMSAAHEWDHIHETLSCFDETCAALMT